MYSFRIKPFNFLEIKKKFKDYEVKKKSFFYEKEWIESCLDIDSLRKQSFCVEIFKKDKPIMLFFFEIKKFFFLKILNWLFVDNLNFVTPIIVDNEAVDKNELEKTFEDILKALKIDLVLLDKNPNLIEKFDNPLKLNSIIKSEKIPLINMKNLSWTKYFEDISNNKTKQTDRRKEKQLREYGKLEILITENRLEKKEILDFTIQNKILYLQKRGIKAEIFQKLYSTLFDKIENNNKYICSAVKINNRIVSSIVGRVESDRYYYLIPSYSENSYQKFSPGRLLLKEQIKWCFENKFQIFDFGPGEFDYKDHWSNDSLYYFKIIKAKSFFGLILKGLYIIKKYLN